MDGAVKSSRWNRRSNRVYFILAVRSSERLRSLAATKNFYSEAVMHEKSNRRESPDKTQVFAKMKLGNCLRSR
jgi:hypothetical protein